MVSSFDPPVPIVPCPILPLNLLVYLEFKILVTRYCIFNNFQCAAIEDRELATKSMNVLLELINTEYSTRTRDIKNMYPKYFVT